MAEGTAALVRRFAAGAEQLAAVVAGLPIGTLSTRPTAEEWSPAEILAHLADAEVLAGERFRRIIADTDPPIQPLAQVDWAEHLRYRERDPDIALASFRALRAANAEILRLVPAEAWERSGIHSVIGPTSLRDQVQSFADHTEEHIAQIAAMRG
ncbi:MAG: DinB family protein [Thermomicrobiales bacterium]